MRTDKNVREKRRNSRLVGQRTWKQIEEEGQSKSRSQNLTAERSFDLRLRASTGAEEERGDGEIENLVKANNSQSKCAQEALLCAVFLCVLSVRKAVLKANAEGWFKEFGFYLSYPFRHGLRRRIQR